MTTDDQPPHRRPVLPLPSRSPTRRARAVLATILTVALGATVIPAAVSSAAPTTPTPRNDPSTITVGTFNVNNGDSGLGRGNTRMNGLAAEINRGGLDVVGLQEIATDMRNNLAPRLSPTYTYSLLGDAKGRNTTGGQIFYRPSVLYPGRVQGTIPLASRPGANPRFGLYQDFYHKGSGAHFLFVSTHLANLAGRGASDLRFTQTQQLLAGIAEVNSYSMPVVVVGDMNSNHGKKYIYDAPRQALQGNGFGEVFDRAATKVNTKYNSYNSQLRTPADGGYRVDQIYVSPTISVHYAENMMRTVRKKIKIRKRGKVKRKTVIRYRSPFLSDHNPIRAILTIPGQ